MKVLRHQASDREVAEAGLAGIDGQGFADTGQPISADQSSGTGLSPGADQLPDADTDRRFGGLARLYGPCALERLSGAHVAVAGIGGVGSWCAEALARSGLGRLTLIDLDHIAESNVNRQVHALTNTLGQAKVVAMAARINEINPSCRVVVEDDFVSAENVGGLVKPGLDVLVDCTDQVSAKIAMIVHCRDAGVPLVVCGGAGGKTNPLGLRATDLSAVGNDALLAKVRNTLRRRHGYPKAADAAGKPRKRIPKLGVRTVWFDQPAILPALWQNQDAAPQGLSCAGYGSAVTVTGVMGMAAAHDAIHWLLHGTFQP
jgi:tRNA A37 threonylcarbamoyladenosine dehydratase